MGRSVEAFLGAAAERFRVYVERLAQSLVMLIGTSRCVVI
jgi:hypothetical protein